MPGEPALHEVAQCTQNASPDNENTPRTPLSHPYPCPGQTDFFLWPRRRSPRARGHPRALRAQVCPCGPGPHPPVPAQLPANSGSFGIKLAHAALDRTRHDVRYEPAYVKLAYPGGDVDPATGVCTDEIIRACRALGLDLQKLVHEDMKANFSKYPKNWGLSRPDRNIDHRRVPNLQTFLKRQGAELPVTSNAEDYHPGDIVTCTVPPHLPHIMMVVPAPDGAPAPGWCTTSAAARSSKTICSPTHSPATTAGAGAEHRGSMKLHNRRQGVIFLIS